jgi:hypothetical protein
METERICNWCEQAYSQKEVERVYGELSHPAILGYCSAKCYTESMLVNRKEPEVYHEPDVIEKPIDTGMKSMDIILKRLIPVHIENKQEKYNHLSGN